MKNSSVWLFRLGLLFAFAGMLASPCFALLAENPLNAALFKAIEKGQTAKVKSLLAQGASANAEQEGNYTALMAAAERGHLAIVKLLLEKGARVNAKTTHGHTVLMTGAFSGNTKIIHLLLKKGANVNAVDKYGGTALSEAIGRSYPQVVKLLLKSGANCRREDSNESSLLLSVIQWEQENTEIVRLFLEQGAEINAKIGRLAWTPLQEAIVRDRTATVRLLLDYGADVNLPDYKGDTPILLAWKNLTILKMLLAKGAKLEERKSEGKIADILLREAAFRGSYEVVEFLLQQGADVNSRDKWGNTALTRAAYHGDAKVVKLLLNKGADIHARNSEGKTALLNAALAAAADVVELLLERGAGSQNPKEELQTALEEVLSYIVVEGYMVKQFPWGMAETAQILLNYGANVQQPNRAGITPFLNAVRKECVWNNGVFLSVCDVFLRAGADINSCDKEGRTALMTAVRSGNYVLLVYLLNKGANIRLKDPNGRTALMYVSVREPNSLKEIKLPDQEREAYAAVIRALMAKGLDIHARDKDNQTVLMIAEKNGLTDMAALLRKMGAKE